MVCGGVEESKSLLTERFDHIFFTGNKKPNKMCLIERHISNLSMDHKVAGRGSRVRMEVHGLRMKDAGQ